jgi:hypothetical protein
LTLTVCASQNVHDFGDLPALFMLVAARDGVFDAMATWSRMISSSARRSAAHG